jgi:hypothetical protein
MSYKLFLVCMLAVMSEATAKGFSNYLYAHPC